MDFTLTSSELSRVAITEDALVSIAVHAVVAHGLNLGELASTVRNRVSYEVERMTGLTVAAVEVHIEAAKADS